MLGISNIRNCSFQDTTNAVSLLESNLKGEIKYYIKCSCQNDKEYDKDLNLAVSDIFYKSIEHVEDET